MTRTDNHKTINYNYDRVYRLTKSSPFSRNKLEKLFDDIVHHHSESYSYDPVGNRQTGPDKFDSYTYNNANELLTSTEHPHQNTQNEYDVNGNLIKKTETIGKWKVITSYTYDDENRLILVSIQKGDKIKEISFAYDPFGRRISKTIEKEEFTDDDDKDNGKHGHNDYPKTTFYIYDNQNIIAEYDGNGKQTAFYIHGPNIDEPLSAEIKNTRIYYHADGLGSITTLTNHMGHKVQQYDYDSFGNIKSTPFWIKQPYTYTGREYDYDTGLYYYRARYYDPSIGRFTTRDPIGFGGGINRYSYVNNSPLNYVDPLGLFANHAYLSLQAFTQVPCPKLYVISADAAQAVDALQYTNRIQNAYWHAMSEPGESIESAMNRAESRIVLMLSQCNAESLGYALHTEQDKYAGGHMGYQPWYGDSIPSFAHWRADTFHSDTAGAIAASANIIRRFKEKCPCACKE